MSTAALLLTAIASAGAQPPVEAPPADDILARIQTARRSRGLDGLSRSALLDAAAIAHAEDMAKRSYFGFESPEGTDVGGWASSAGYEIGWITEKIGKTNGPVVELLDSWLNADDDAALFSEQPSEIGIATARAGPDTLLVLVFATTIDDLTRKRAAGLRDLEPARDELLERVNACRAESDRRPLHRHEALERAAQAHAEELLAGRQDSGRARRSRDVADRALEERYPVRQIVANLLDGPTTVETALDAWLASAEHRRNLLLGAYRDVGLGVAVGENPDGRVTVVWVLYLARPRA